MIKKIHNNIKFPNKKNIDYHGGGLTVYTIFW